MKFWDSSAIAPLLVTEADSAFRESQLRSDADMLVWYGTSVELESAICRREREMALDSEQASQARAKLVALSGSWLEVQPTISVRTRAIRLLRVHSLRAADAFQLAASLCAFKEVTAGNCFLTADLQLARAAMKEGFQME